MVDFSRIAGGWESPEWVILWGPGVLPDATLMGDAHLIKLNKTYTKISPSHFCVIQEARHCEGGTAMTSLSRPRVEFISTILQTVLNLGLLCSA